MKTHTYILSSLALVLLVAHGAYAQDDKGGERKPGLLGSVIRLEDRTKTGTRSAATVQADVEVQTSAASRTEARVETRNEMRGDKAARELDQRISALQKLATRVSAMKRVSDSAKASINATITAQIDALTSLKAKIAADTDPEVLKADMESITKAYRIYALILPQTTVLATADRALTTADLMTTLVGKLDARILEAKNAGKDVSASETASAAMKAKIATATTDANAAITLVVSLKPDNGDKTIAESNRKALVDARAKIKSAEASLKAARKDAETIVKALKSFDIKVDAKVNVKSEDR